jgi:DNA-binding HxlR family transcriptional regulator
MARCRSCNPVPEEVRRAADLLERPRTISVVWASFDGAHRFNEFKAACGSIPPRTLTDRLRDLEEAGVLEKRVVHANPPYYEYTLTERGQKLRPLVEALSRLT